ncbi:MAG: phosphate signaling complex protein PhoU [Kiritimatiellae bacterium]|jgi:phosphate transport system protein|nr:phosphate signaling complex protein PhoU [Kiritimatiellia bacterium]
MLRHLQREVANIKEKVILLSATVEQNVSLATKAVQNKDPELAREVVDSDYQIDQKEVEIEEDCLKILALHQPVAVDLRFLIAVLKMNNDLERIADLAVNIAEKAIFLSLRKETADPITFNEMVVKVKDMLRMSVEALVDLDIDKAKLILKMDNDVDEINREHYYIVRKLIKAGESDVNDLVHLLDVSRNLERIADHTTNIAEDIIYMISGDIIRHSGPSKEEG